MDTKITIRMLRRPPVTIAADRWPVVASVTELDSKGHWTAANRLWRLTIRRHADGRALLVGHYETEIRGDHDRRVGVLVADGSDARSMRAAAERLERAIGAPHGLTECVMREVRERLRAGNP